ncbi:hypothetical protein Tco_0767731 [Tanacetum coccineum]
MESEFVAFSAAELWGSLEAKYMAEDASSKKFLVSNFKNYNMTNSRPVMEQYNELLGIIGRFTQHKINMDEDNDKPKGNNVAGPLVFNMIEHNKSFRKLEDLKKDCKGGKVSNKANGSGIDGLVDGSTNSLKDDDVSWWVESGATVHVCKDGYVIFDENRFSLVPRPSQRFMINGTEDIGGSVVPKEVTEEVVQQPELELRKRKRNRTPKNFGPEFQLYLIKGTRDEVSDQHSYCFNVEDDPRIFDEAMKSQDVAFWKESINDEMNSIMGNNT